MRKIVTAAFISLDGVMQAPGGPQEDPTGGFDLGGWTAPYWDDVIGQAMGEVFQRPFDLVLGRKTYDIFAAHWPYVSADSEDAPIGELFGNATKYVASHTSGAFTWRNSHWLGANAVAAVRELKASEGPDLLTQGSSDFLQTLFAAELIDELRLLTYPVVLGSGKRLFGDGARPGAFRLSRITNSLTGVIVTTYERAGEVATGSFALESPTEAELERRRNLE